MLGLIDQPERQGHGHQKRQCYSGHAGVPAKLVEELSQHRAADETSGEVTGEIDAARGSAVRGRRSTDKSGCRCLREEGPDPNQDHADQNGSQIWREHQRQSQDGERER